MVASSSRAPPLPSRTSGSGVGAGRDPPAHALPARGRRRRDRRERGRPDARERWRPSGEWLRDLDRRPPGRGRGRPAGVAVSRPASLGEPRPARQLRRSAARRPVHPRCSRPAKRPGLGGGSSCPIRGRVLLPSVSRPGRREPGLRSAEPVGARAAVEGGWTASEWRGTAATGGALLWPSLSADGSTAFVWRITARDGKKVKELCVVSREGPSPAPANRRALRLPGAGHRPRRSGCGRFDGRVQRRRHGHDFPPRSEQLDLEFPAGLAGAVSIRPSLRTARRRLGGRRPRSPLLRPCSPRFSHR